MDMESAVADRDFVGIVFKQLSTRERQALWHSAVESRPLADVAGRLRLSYMAAAQVLHRARRHAVAVAARVAVVVGVFQLVRQRPGAGSVLIARLAAAATVPVILVSLQSSSATSSPTAASPVIVTPVAGSTAVTAPKPASQALSSSAKGGPDVGAAAQPSGSTATLKLATSTVSRLLGSLPSAPPVLGAPTLPASVSALPSPPAIR
jgi:hypothetical protein